MEFRHEAPHVNLPYNKFTLQISGLPSRAMEILTIAKVHAELESLSQGLAHACSLSICLFSVYLFIRLCVFLSVSSYLHLSPAISMSLAS